MADTDPAALEREIERTRAELARTVDAIADRVSPKRMAARGVARAKASAEQFVASVGDLVLGDGRRGDERGDEEAGPEGAAAERRAAGPAPLLIGVGAVLVVGAAVVLLRRRCRRR